MGAKTYTVAGIPVTAYTAGTKFDGPVFVIDLGHGKHPNRSGYQDTGACRIGGKICSSKSDPKAVAREDKIAEQHGLLLARELAARGVNVIITRGSDINAHKPQLASRTNVADTTNAVTFVSLHADVGGQRDYFHIYHNARNALGTGLATTIETTMSKDEKRHGVPEVKAIHKPLVVTRPQLHQPDKRSAVLVELGSMSHAPTLARLQDINRAGPLMASFADSLVADAKARGHEIKPGTAGKILLDKSTGDPKYFFGRKPTDPTSPILFHEVGPDGKVIDPAVVEKQRAAALQAERQLHIDKARELIAQYELSIDKSDPTLFGPEQRGQLQTELKGLGLYKGPIDKDIGSGSIRAIADFKVQHPAASAVVENKHGSERALKAAEAIKRDGPKLDCKDVDGPETCPAHKAADKLQAQSRAK